MKTGKILPFFILLLGSLAIVQTVTLVPTPSKLFGTNFQGLGFETEKIKWNLISIREGTQWKDIQPSKNQFIWTSMDKAYEVANQREITLKWDFMLDSAEFPTWLWQNNQKQEVSVKHEQISSLMENVCARYQKMDLISLVGENFRQMSQIAQTVNKYCPNTKILISYKDLSKIRQIMEEEYFTLIDLKQKNVLEGIQVDLKGQKVYLSTVETVTKELALNGFPIYVSGLSIKENNAESSQKTIDSLYSNNYVRAIIIDFPNRLENTDTRDKWIETVNWLNSQHFSREISTESQLTLRDDQKAMDEFGVMSASHQSVRLLAISASFTRTVTKWTLKADATESSSSKPIVSYFWNWGDGKNDTITNGTTIAYHTYATSGTVSASLTITDNAGASDTTRYNVNIVGNALPTAAFTSAITAYTVAGTSTSTDTDGTVVGYEWNWGDNTTFDTTANPSHTYALAGTYTIKLRVTDQNGGVSAANTGTVTVPTAAALPVPRFIATVNKRQVLFDASTSSDDFGTIVSYFWTYNDGTTQTTTTPTVTHVYPSAKNYNVVLQVTNNRTAKSSLQKQITTVNNVAPVSVNPVATIVGYDVTVTTTSSDSDGTIVEYKWGWGDLTPNTSTTVSSALHTYAKVGSYSVTLQVFDNDGASSTVKTISVTVPSVLPTAHFVSYVDKLFVTFDASTSVDPFGTIMNYVWNFADGIRQNSTTPIITHAYASIKSWNVVLQVIDDKGASHSVTIATPTTNNFLPVAKYDTPTVNGYIVNVVSTSTDSDGTITATRWNWGDNTSNSTTASASHTYDTPGTYTITLSVVDNFPSTSIPKTVQVTVPSSPPVASFSTNVTQLAVAFDASASASAFGGAITSYLWDFGDTITQTTTVPTVSKTYSTVGTYTVTLQVTDSKGSKGTTSKTVVTVSNAVPISNFNVVTLNGYTLNVASTSTDSDGTIASYKWSWGDSTPNDTTASPTHTFTQAGTYTISLTVVDNDGASSTIKTSTVTVPTVLPVSSFTTNVTKMSVAFDGSSSTDQFGSITSYVWTFGDGSTQTTITPTISHTYTTVGTFTVSMKVIDNKNAQATSSKTVTTIANTGPTSNFDISSLNGYTVNVASTSTDSDGTIASYKWSWGDNTANSTTSSSTHTYTQIGTYTIGLIVVDNDGTQSTIKTSTVTVPTVLPVSSFTTNVTKMSVAFDGSSSTDQFGSITSYVWTFGDGNTVTTTNPTTSHTYTTVGTFTVSLKIIDNKNAEATSSKSVTTVANNLPVASFNIASHSGYLVNVVSTSTDSDGTIAMYQWNWGDGTSNDTGSSASHTYNQIGTFEIKLSVKDNNGDWSSIATYSVTVPDTLPIASFTATVNQFVVTVDATASSDGYGAINTYTWNWGDGTTETKSEPTATHTYLAPDLYVISLQVSNSKGANSFETQKSVNARSETGLYPAWRWENFYVQKTVNGFKYFVSTSRWQSNDGGIKYYHYFSKTF